MHPMLNIAVRAARQAGNFIARSAEHVDRFTIESKAHNDFVTEVDRVAEQEIIQVIHKAYPDHAILAEESGRQKAGAEYQWVIDPLDGTTNFLHGFPQFAVSIALQHKGRTEQAVVYNPISQELYTASRGSGAQLNGRRIRVAQRRHLEGALLGTGFPFREEQRLDTYLNTFKILFGEVADIRRAGSAALDLAYVAAGRLDGFWEFGLSPWDMAAGSLLIQEAGGVITDFAGGDNYLESGNVIAGNIKLHPVILRKIRPQLPEEARR
ncbi:inositol-1-monophosphatase [Thiohalomonas denitrificans]|uniref:Inositol-1-monophosphatase n=1 Tax=Thiohalomonas denitrificans TaxID=415747 RepID=A0A1G5Q0M1_9GAMM|nr:inositol-1-monophosphatase [Thiohalomonas denitrificans]SCZ55415.1 myo-inositol-1(or 4)-monophosphatase [Thiohalomonas denitrificans]